NDDLYNTKIMNGEWKQEYKANIVYDKQFVKQGEGSLKIERISGEFPEFYIRFANALLPEDFEVKKTHVVGLWVYNANDTDADIIINLRNVQNFTVLSKAQTAKANGWTRIECDFSEFAWAKKDVIGGFSISVNGAIPSEIYYDGLSISDDAEEVVVDLNALIESIVAPDSVVTYATFKENAKFIDLVDYAMGVYQNMSAEDKKAVKPTNLALLDKYSKMFPEHKVVYSSHRDVIMRWAYGAQMAILEEIDDTFGGVWSISVNTEKEQSWYNIGLSGNDMDKYERVVFWIYNPTDQDLRLTLSKGGWKPEYFKYAEFDLLSHEWTEISIPMADFRSNVDAASSGNIYCLFYRTDYKSIKGTFKLTSYFGICGESAITDSAQAIVDAIDGLVAVDGLTEDNQEALEAIANVRKEYDKLSDTEKAHINNYSKLVALEEKAFSFKMDKLRLKMNGLNDPLTKDDATAVFEIYEEYSQFTDLEKSMMDDKEESAILEAYETLKVYIVDAYIAELPDVNELNAVHFGLINTIAERYDTLSNEQKSALENGEKLLDYLKVLEEYTVITDYSHVSDIRLG
ncbi:MAG: hypothetical protein MJ072_03010, partial [Clostridia bacterium]|nr:hypothetical protein [Clostridia bacterium]